MNYIKSLFIALSSLLVVVGCNKDIKPTIEVDRHALYFSDWGAPAQSVSFVTEDAVRVAMVSISDGFECRIDNSAHKITVTPIGNKEGSNDELEKVGTLYVNALSKDGKTSGQTIYLYICEEVVLDANYTEANCYIATKPNVKYTFQADRRPDRSTLDTKSAKLLWQSDMRVIRNVDYCDGKVSFIIEPSYEDTAKVPNANGVIAAYNAKGEIIWSWHIWITNTDPREEICNYSNGAVFMERNLGAFTNSNASENTQKIHDSYGLYYQWGRKDPFLRPETYDCSLGVGETIYNGESVHYTEEKTVETSATTGTEAYATANPMHFITNAKCIEEGGDGIGDWLYEPNNRLWNEEWGKILLNDPCPYGWKVPSANDFADLQLTDSEDATDLDVARKRFGWWLNDGANNFFYNACGYRRYNDGKIQNMNYHPSYPSVPEPWEGHYWTTDVYGDGTSVSMYFDLTTTRTINKFQNAKPSRRANGLQIRCIKVK
ncbi:MAG: hypothetical protein IKL60_04985 [Alistipes sp.]|nr:hypothetical protein [Alistipes sp.]